MMTTDIHTLAGAYVLNALSDTERAAFARHMADCESCTEEVAELREGIARLADTTWSVPPPRMRDNVLAGIRQTPQVRSARPVRDGASGTLLQWRRRTAVAVAAGILAVGAGAATWAVQEQRVRDRDAIVADQQRMQSVLTAPDGRFHSGAVTGGGRVTVVLSESQDAGVVVLSQAPPPGPDKTYQLWAIDNGAPRSVGVLDAGRSDATKVVTGVRGMDSLGVSLEPAGGSDRPTETVAGVPVT